MKIIRVRHPWLAGLFITLMTWFPTSVFAHPDLLDQIDRQTALIAQNPDDVQALLKRGELHRRHGEFELSAADFLAARELAPSNKLLNWHEGLLALDTDQYELSNRLLSQYLENSAEHAAGWYFRGKARVGMKQFLAAADDFARSIVVNKRPSPVLYRAQALSLIAAGQDHTEQASAVIVEGLGHFPREVNLLGLAVDLSLSQADSRGALVHFSRVNERLYILPQWQFRRAIWFCIQDETEKAREAFEVLMPEHWEGLQSRPGTWVPPEGLTPDLRDHPESGRCIEVLREYLGSQEP